MLHLRERLVLPLLRASAALLHTSAASRPLASASSSFSLHLYRCLFSTAARSATTTPFSVEEYLVATCGLTGAQALKASKNISHLKSASNLDAVLALLSGVGLSRADLAAIVAAHPQLLCVRADNIARRIDSLRDRVGLSDPQICSFLLAGGARGLRSCDMASRLEFWIPFLGSFEVLLEIVKGSYRILTADIEKVIKPNIALLQECGFSVCDVVKVSRYNKMLLTMNPKQVETSVQRADKLGIRRSSSLFKYAVGTTCRISEGKATARMKFLSITLGCSKEKIRDIVSKIPATLACSEENLCSKIELLTSTLGCSREEICAAICMKPQILGLSEENLRQKINFMITEVGLEPKYIVERPLLLTYSLEKRIVPRHSVTKILQTMGSMKEFVSFLQLLAYSDEDFHARYIDPYRHAAPALMDSYPAA
ncbi:hypothetical protein E2562_001987 [Oryza meyeriana var. granulata]|uniref:Uncharacterized protein n=1 Tax=Oryza meyeriana var. granulata TaxID=110450 RepID=A0A6G1C404_9ORYZ|nr:hypothetical protein E2562_001987 [Oryza meyeriana var. granulata]KAF0894697.1 hypothetical protein E2562_001987 [Oryza meyeriana var. granulata]KAF0894698.1 hypothetical protein E2562_001987 [Oryza meyeriana var. granulata]